MTEPVIIYISAAADLAVEREAVARMIAELPLTLPWHILQTPLQETDRFDLTALQQADLHLLLMGSDIRAPVGLELYFARQAYRQTVAYLKQAIPRTPAGQNFIKDAQLAWQPFTDQHALRQQTQHLVIDHLLHNQKAYALTKVEVAQLEDLRAAEPSDKAADPKAGAIEGGDVGRSAVILSRERYEPSEGILLDHLIAEDEEEE